MRLTRSAVEVFFEGTRIASHLRLYGRPNQYSTVEAHMPPDHQKYLEWNGDRFLRWAGSVGPNTQAVVRQYLTAYKIEQQNRKTYTCHPSYKTIGRAVGMTENTVRKYIRSLEAKGFIYTEPTTVHLRNGRVRNGNLRYTVRPIADAIERYEEKLLAAANQARAQQEYQQRVEAYDQIHPDEQTSVPKGSTP